MIFSVRVESEGWSDQWTNKPKLKLVFLEKNILSRTFFQHMIQTRTSKHTRPCKNVSDYLLCLRVREHAINKFSFRRMLGSATGIDNDSDFSATDSTDASRYLRRLLNLPCWNKRRCYFVWNSKTQQLPFFETPAGRDVCCWNRCRPLCFVALLSFAKFMHKFCAQNIQDLI